MFVECFSGLMGGGKSFFSVKRAAEHIAGGGIVFTNIDFKLDPWFNEAYAHKLKSFWLPECYDGCRMEMHKGGIVLPVMRRNEKTGQPEFEYNSRGFRKYLELQHKWLLQNGQYNYLPDDHVNADLPSRLPQGSQTRPVLVILDEALDHFEAGASSRNANAEFRSFLRHIRKLGINLIFIAQDFGSLDPKIRVLTHFVWKFRDMYNWPVPIFNRPLPPPWRDYIICEKFHKSHFGKMKAETINKNTWVYRDTLIFQCYQSVSMHNHGIKMADDMKTDFGDSGKIVKGKKAMNKFEKAALYACLLLGIIGVFRSPKIEAVQSESSESVPSEATVSAEPERPRVNVLYGKFRYHESNGQIKRLFVDGIPYQTGQQTTAGTVLSVKRDQVHIMDELGNTTFIYPDYSNLFNVEDSLTKSEEESPAPKGS
ncbi:hypothetical protein EGM51_03695 [Verrucomicrobia bacterium S94]|nr:hypothetical protein EGM51_03695 [Verrucomicrobia bacterium S94]